MLISDGCFLGNFGLQNEIMLLVQRLWVVPLSIKKRCTVSLFLIFCMCEDEFSIEHEMTEKEKHGLESNENSPEVGGLIHVN